MANRSKNSGNSISIPQVVERLGVLTVVPSKTTVTVKEAGHRGVESYETKSRVSYSDKQSGSYGRETTKEKASADEFQWKNGTSGTKCEYTISSTVRVGDKSGYTEVYNEQKVRNVSYNNNNNNGGKELITYNNGADNVEYSHGCGYDSDDYEVYEDFDGSDDYDDDSD